MLRFSLLFLLALPGLRADFTCPSGFINYNGYCFAVIANMLSHDQAESYCSNNFGAKLATIDNSALNTYIASYARSYESLWLGYKCSSKSQCTGDNGIAINTTQFFYGGQANPSTGHCVVLDTNGPFAGKWMSLDCNQTSNFVCGMDITNQVASNMKASKCGAPYKLNIPVNITSMNYPSNYDNNENCAYFVYGGPFTIYFDDFYTESCCDSVSIYSSSNNNIGSNTFVGQYAGSMSPFNVTITSGSALITFVTDSSQTFRGFSARIVPF